MRFTAEIMNQVYIKNRGRAILNAIKTLKKEIKEYAKCGYKSKVTELVHSFNDEEQERITNYFVEKVLTLSGYIMTKLR